MRRHPFIAGSALLLTLLSVPGDAQAPSGMRVLSPDRLRDGKVISAEDNFSIVVPPGEWQWWERNEEAKSVSSFTALEAGSGTVVSVTVTRRIFRDVSREFAEGVVQGMKNSSVAGGRVAVHAVESSERPLAGATRIVSTITLPGREPLESQTLVFKRGYAYAIQVMSPEDPRAILDAIGGSFKNLEEPQIAPVDYSKILLFLAFACFGAMLISLLINSGMKRLVLNGAALSACLMLVLLAATSALLALTIDRTADEGRQGEAFGALTGAVMIPLIIAIVLARRFEKQRVQERLAASMPPGSVVGGSLTLGYVLFILGVLGAGISFPESKGGILAVALLELLVTCLAVLVFVRHARRKEIARLAAAMPPAETAKPAEG